MGEATACRPRRATETRRGAGLGNWRPRLVVTPLEAEEAGEGGTLEGVPSSLSKVVRFLSGELTLRLRWEKISLLILTVHESGEVIKQS